MKQKRKRPELDTSGPALKAYPSGGQTHEAWWYANKGSIEVVARTPKGDTTMARVRLTDILKRLKVP